MYKVTFFVEDREKSAFSGNSTMFKQDMASLGYKIARMTGEYVHEEPTK